MKWFWYNFCYYHWLIPKNIMLQTFLLLIINFMFVQRPVQSVIESNELFYSLNLPVYSN